MNLAFRWVAVGLEIGTRINPMLVRLHRVNSSLYLQAKCVSSTPPSTVSSTIRDLVSARARHVFVGTAMIYHNIRNTAAVVLSLGYTMTRPLSVKESSASPNRRLKKSRGSLRNQPSLPEQLVTCYAHNRRLWAALIMGLFVISQWSFQSSPWNVDDDDERMSGVPELAEDSRPTSGRQTWPYHKDSRVENIDNDGLERRARQAEQSARNLETYDCTESPVIPQSVYQPQSALPLPVVLLGSRNATEDEYHGSLLDGISRSRYLYVSTIALYDLGERTWQSDTWQVPSAKVVLPTVYIVDWAALERDCHALEHMMAETQVPSNAFFVYFDYSSSARTKVCPCIEDHFTKERIRLAKRSLVQERYWNQSNDWVEIGEVPSNIGNTITGGPVLHAPHALREPFVDLVKRQVGTTPSAKKLVNRNRKTDVSFFWRKGDNSHYSFLRRLVGYVVMDMGKKYRWLVKILGDEDAIEFNLAQPEYADQLLNSKIVVVAQRDEWEDHYRLFESMASGALVFTDVMVAAPRNLRNRTNVVIYDGPESLQKLLRYYLSSKQAKTRLTIARRGYEYVMGKHRSWHRLEALLFGTQLTQPNQPDMDAPLRKRGKSRKQYSDRATT